MIESYERRHRLIAPIIRAVLSRLVGWSYAGTAGDRRKVAAQLPFIAFRPRISRLIEPTLNRQHHRSVTIGFRSAGKTHSASRVQASP